MFQLVVRVRVFAFIVGVLIPFIINYKDELAIRANIESPNKQFKVFVRIG